MARGNKYGSQGYIPTRVLSGGQTRRQQSRAGKAAAAQRDEDRINTQRVESTDRAERDRIRAALQAELNASPAGQQAPVPPSPMPQSSGTAPVPGAPPSQPGDPAYGPPRTAMQAGTRATEGPGVQSISAPGVPYTQPPRMGPLDPAARVADMRATLQEMGVANQLGMTYREFLQSQRDREYQIETLRAQQEQPEPPSELDRARTFREQVGTALDVRGANRKDREFELKERGQRDEAARVLSTDEFEQGILSRKLDIYSRYMARKDLPVPKGTDWGTATGLGAFTDRLRTGVTGVRDRLRMINSGLESGVYDDPLTEANEGEVDITPERRKLLEGRRDDLVEQLDAQQTLLKAADAKLEEMLNAGAQGGAPPPGAGMQPGAPGAPPPGGVQAPGGFSLPIGGEGGASQGGAGQQATSAAAFDEYGPTVPVNVPAEALTGARRRNSQTGQVAFEIRAGENKVAWVDQYGNVIGQTA